MGCGYRQPLWTRQHRDGGYRECRRAGHQPGPLRQLHPDRCCHQPRQFRRRLGRVGYFSYRRALLRFEELGLEGLHLADGGLDVGGLAGAGYKGQAGGQPFFDVC